MNKSFSAVGVLRNSMIGDIIASIPFCTYLEKKYPNSYKCAYIDLKCAAVVPFLLNQNLIDQVRISHKEDVFTDKDWAFYHTFDFRYDPFPKVTDLEYFNNYHFCEELFRMNSLIGIGRIDPKEYDILTKEEKKPRLHRWFNIDRHKKTIAVWAKAGYANEDISIDLRSPSKAWWEDLCFDLGKIGYKVLLFGHPNSENINYTVDCRKLSLFDAIKESLACDLVIATDSGAGGWIIGAYGMNQVLLYTNYKINHIRNYQAICPINYKNNCHYIRGATGIDSIEHLNVLESIKDFK